MGKKMENSSVHQRYRFIELITYWEGRINATILAQQFGQSRQQNSADINSYKNLAPDNLIYDSSLKVNIPTDHFLPQFISTQVDEYLHWFHTGQLPSGAPPPLSESLKIPSRKISPQIMRCLVAAIRQQKRIEVDYVSLNNPNREGRVIAPHSFVNTGLRWHLRAWCEKSSEYRDFVLSRFRGEPELLEKSLHSAAQDAGWNTQVTIILQPDPRLSPAKREVLENDYQMQNGQLHIVTKGCLVNYLLREMQINTKMLDGTPEAQQLVLVNQADIKSWLFEG
jgi:hypothetical protein